MRVTVIAGGSRGDVQPLVALGLGIRDAGHEVTVAAPRDFAGLITGRGLRFSPLTYTIADQIGSELGTRWVTNSSGNPIRELLNLTRLFRRWAPVVADGVLALSGSADLFLSGLLTVDAAAALAGHDGVRHANALLSPFHPSADGRVGLQAPRPSHRSRLNLAAGRSELHWMAGAFGAVGARVRTELGMRSAGRRDFSRTLQTVPTVLGASRLLVPTPTDWPGHLHVTGAWFLPTVPTWRPPSALTGFLAAGPPPIYLGFGSMGGARNPGIARAVASAIAATGVRAVMPETLAAACADDGDNILGVDDVPHEWLFPRMSAVIHHGGAGTTHAALRAGIPTGVVSHMSDQPYWGRRLTEVGVGAGPLPLHRLDADRLSELIVALRSGTERADTARRLSLRLASEQGVRDAVVALGLQA
ncbi:MAG: glycosyltransferase [Propioniciclava sp.]